MNAAAASQHLKPTVFFTLKHRAHFCAADWLVGVGTDDQLLTNRGLRDRGECGVLAWHA